MCNYPNCDSKKKLQARYNILDNHVKKIHFFSIRIINLALPTLIYIGLCILKIIHSVQHSNRPKSYWKNKYKIEEQS